MKCKVKTSGSKKSEPEHVRPFFLSSIKRLTKKFVEVSRCSCMQNTHSCFSTFFAAQNYTNFKYYRNLRFLPWLNLYYYACVGGALRDEKELAARPLSPGVSTLLRITQISSSHTLSPKICTSRTSQIKVKGHKSLIPS